MKKFVIILAVLAAFSLAGCASSGSGGTEPFVVDLTKLTQYQRLDGDKLGQSYGNLLRNQTAFTRSWQGFLIRFPADFVDIKKYSRLTLAVKYFNAAGAEITPRDSMGQVTIIYDVNGDWHGPSMGPGHNTPVKEMNVMGFSGIIQQDRGIRHTMDKVPQAIFIQRAQDDSVAFIELTRIVFHNGNYKYDGPVVQGEGPEGS